MPVSATCMGAVESVCCVMISKPSAAAARAAFASLSGSNQLSGPVDLCLEARINRCAPSSKALTPASPPGSEKARYSSLPHDFDILAAMRPSSSGLRRTGHVTATFRVVLKPARCSKRTVGYWRGSGQNGVHKTEGVAKIMLQPDAASLSNTGMAAEPSGNLSVNSSRRGCRTAVRHQAAHAPATRTSLHRFSAPDRRSRSWACQPATAKLKREDPTRQRADDLQHAHGQRLPISGRFAQVREMPAALPQ